MTDLVGTVISWTLIVVASAALVYHWGRTIRFWRLETKSAVMIMFSTGVLAMVVPKKVYPGLQPEAADAFSWLAVLMILGAIAIDLLSERDKRNAASGETSSSDPIEKR